MNILLVDTNFSSMPIYESLAAGGHNVFVIGKNRNDFLAISLSNYIYADYSDKEILASVVEQYLIDYIIPGCNDASYAACTGLPNVQNAANIDSADVTQKILNKELFRNFAQANNLSVPRKHDIAQVHSLPPRHPIIVKPTDSFSGKGITKMNSPAAKELESAIQLAVQNSSSQKFLVEDYIEGQLYSHSAFIEAKSIVREFWVTEYGFANHYSVDTSYVAHELSDAIKNKIRHEITQLSHLLRIKNGLVHTQFIVDRNQDTWLIEITRRCPGDLYSKLIQHSCGFDYAAAYSSYFIHPHFNLSQIPADDGKIILRHTITDNHTGIFKSIEFINKISILEYIQIACIGTTIKPSPAGRIGILFLELRDQDELKETLSLISDRKLYKINYMNVQ